MKVQLLAADAVNAAQDLLERLRPFCKRVQIAGSLRRGRPLVSDIELVMEPLLDETTTDLFGSETQKVNLLYDELARMRASGELLDRLDANGRPAFGERFQRMVYRGIAADLFCVLPPAQWGMILLIRTGPADFNKRLFTALPMGMRVDDGRLLDRGQPILTPEEADVFAAIGRPFIEPRERK